MILRTRQALELYNVNGQKDFKIQITQCWWNFSYIR